MWPAALAEYGSNAAQLIVTYEWRPDTPDPVGPADEATVTTTRPKLEVTPEADGDGNPVKYWFRVYTDPEYDAVASGQVINSGWIDDPYWTPPAEYLTDGGTYYWTATSTDWDNTTGAPGPFSGRPRRRSRSRSTRNSGTSAMDWARSVSTSPPGTARWPWAVRAVSASPTTPPTCPPPG